ncbi:M4 family metallopeptidase [Shewanella schlegeliana]|uniref:M4 family metallopeptidase n=1 Tax=Shewanella schlegeliana TaxID=190308 RepID=A0ABS1SXF9_9GAMM|nr:M4 family metallopeptidase [Shewanella schlegeliana]MBL4913228.1 M4 family metallopeptidase [Shewanella schlegeliana]MCL1109183.1 M4 family metallopeptidase [Shewanella schlegeliana]GIU24260.1 hemagglutinin [Shewanella schlegeliana]
MPTYCKVSFTILIYFITVSNVWSATWETIEDGATINLMYNAQTTEFEKQEQLTSHFSRHIFKDTKNKLKEDKRLTLNNNTTQIRYHQEYLGVPVIGSNIVIEQTHSSVSDNNSNYRIRYGRYLDNIPTFPIKESLITPEDAHDILIREFNVIEKIRSKDSKLYLFQENNTTSPIMIYLTSALLEKSEPSRPFALINATTGEVIKKWDGIRNIITKIVARVGTGPGGNKKTSKYFYGTKYEKLLVTKSDNNICTMENDYIKTINLENKKTGNKPFSYTCPNNTVMSINGAYSPLNDAHFFATETMKMFQDWYGVKSIPKKLPVKVHYGINYDGAFWDGKEITFGDGDQNSYPMIVLDIVAHEIGHAFTGRHSSLLSSGESGAIDEAFADMTGETAEYFVKKKNDWLIGYESTKGSEPLRSMKAPDKDGKGIKHYKHYKQNMDKYKASGIFNYAFYLLANKPGWNIRKAFALMVHANIIYWRMDTNFEDAACYINHSAKDKGFNPLDVVTVFSKVGVNATCSNGTEIQVGRIVQGMSGAKNSKHLFYLNVPRGAKNLTFKTSNGNGDVDIYISKKPSSASQECGSFQSGNEELCRIANPKIGRYYFTLYGASKFSGITMVADYEKDGGVYRTSKSYIIPDNNPSGAYSPNWVTSVQDYKTAIVSVNIEHSDTSDLIVKLIPPVGESYLLHNRVMYRPSRIKRTYRIKLNDSKVRGIWSLSALDTRPSDNGRIMPWSIYFEK